MRRFLIENRRRISQIIVILLAVLLTNFFVKQMATEEQKIISNNQKVYYNNKGTYVKNINVEELKSASDYSKTYTFIDLNNDGKQEIILKYYGNGQNCYFLIYKQNNKYIFNGPININGLENIKQDGTIKIDSNTIGILKFVDYNIILERVTYINQTEEVTKYIVNNKDSNKSDFDEEIKQFDKKVAMNWKKF